ncbi:DMT family transporter [Hymenobacter nivis]|uniref:DMT family transporter n=1 Tax=Hymenobacter nivis TaxID=1850093 RepID=A0A502GXY7_9BACT|nr:DMT family transporter [Hymenobacter nivis]TPG67277.1 DMT family transporter [Hymenobacter nivis]
MQTSNLSASFIYPLIIAAGILQAWGPPMNGALQKSLVNPWLASLVSFLPIIALLLCLFICIPKPLPTMAGLQSMPWWAPLGGLLGAGAVVAGLMFVNKIGAGAFAGLTISANLLMSVFIDKFGWFGVEVHALSPGRMAGCALMVIGIVLISKF